MALVQSSENSDSDDEDVNAPAAAVYKTHSTSIFDLLEDLKEKAEEELSDLRKAETALDDAKTALAEANADCLQVAADHEATVTGRTEELTALATAKKILMETSSGAVSQAYSF